MEAKSHPQHQKQYPLQPKPEHHKFIDKYNDPIPIDKNLEPLKIYC